MVREQQEEKIYVTWETRASYNKKTLKKNIGEEHHDANQDSYAALNVNNHIGEDLCGTNIVRKIKDENIVVTRETIEEELCDLNIVHKQK